MYCNSSWIAFIPKKKAPNCVYQENPRLSRQTRIVYVCVFTKKHELSCLCVCVCVCVCLSFVRVSLVNVFSFVCVTQKSPKFRQQICWRNLGFFFFCERGCFYMCVFCVCFLLGVCVLQKRARNSVNRLCWRNVGFVLLFVWVYVGVCIFLCVRVLLCFLLIRKSLKFRQQSLFHFVCVLAFARVFISLFCAWSLFCVLLGRQLRTAANSCSDDSSRVRDRVSNIRMTHDSLMFVWHESLWFAIDSATQSCVYELIRVRDRVSITRITRDLFGIQRDRTHPLKTSRYRPRLTQLGENRKVL